jgi:hypothetical protein
MNSNNAYLVKPGDSGGLDEMLRDMSVFWLGWNRHPDRCESSS